MFHMFRALSKRRLQVKRIQDNVNDMRPGHTPDQYRDTIFGAAK